MVVGGGATGAGVAVDAASRGYSVLLLESSDFGKGTSSRSTKLVHGGVRYLSQGNISLVLGALRERAALRANAPHLVRPLQFVVPSYAWWESPLLRHRAEAVQPARRTAGIRRLRDPLARSRRSRVCRRCVTPGLRGGVTYFDGQFDDARLVVNLVQTAAEQGAVVLNYARVTGVTDDRRRRRSTASSRVDVESGRELRVPARVVINATGPFADGVRRLAAARRAGADRAEPGHPPGVRPLVPAGRLRPDGAADTATAG